MDSVKHIVALSGGKDSTAMALRLAEVEPKDYQFVITPTGDELPEMYEHWRLLGDLLGEPVDNGHIGVFLAGLDPPAEDVAQPPDALVYADAQD